MLVTKGGFIFRSDSNSEDLSGFAGAGLFDSYAIEEEQEIRISYASEKLMSDFKFRENFIQKVGIAGQTIEDLYDGFPQDIEGCLS